MHHGRKKSNYPFKYNFKLLGILFILLNCEKLEKTIFHAPFIQRSFDKKKKNIYLFKTSSFNVLISTNICFSLRA